MLFSPACGPYPDNIEDYLDNDHSDRTSARIPEETLQHCNASHPHQRTRRPGAMGKRPTGPIVATRTATPERGSVKIFLDRLRALRSLFLLALIGKRRRDAVTA